MKQKIKVLHLEDSPFDAELVARQLKKAEIDTEILVVSEKEDFINALKDFSFDIILSDHSLAAFDSHEALKMVKDAGIAVPFILVTANINDEFAAKVMKDGAYGYILKDRLNRLHPAVINSIGKRCLEEKEQAPHERLAFHIENTIPGLIEWDYILHVKAFSKQAEKIFGRSLEEFSANERSDYAKILEEDYNELFDEEGKRLLSVVQENVKKMGILIGDLLAFSRLETKDIHKSNVNMKQLTENAVEELNKLMPNKAEIKINYIEPALADHKLMNQVWMNLLSNAIKYSFYTESPLIEISCLKKNEEVIYSIADNGAGFDMQYAHKLFSVFQRLHDADEFEGTGVGLALVHGIITKHGGKIWANAEIGKGATFYFSLPEKNNKNNS